MQIRVEEKGISTVISVEGRLDSSNSGQLEKKLFDCIEAGKKDLIINFSKLDYISSAGLRVLLMGAKKIKVKEGKLVLAGLNEKVREVFDIAGFTSIFPMLDQV